MDSQHRIGTFIHKLQYLLQRQEYQSVIAWDKSRTMIDILDPKKMEQDLIPVFFRHQKMESFVRQLNLYGFKKIKHQGRQRFTHAKLLRGEPIIAITSTKHSKKLCRLLVEHSVDPLRLPASLGQLQRLPQIQANHSGLEIRQVEAQQQPKESELRQVRSTEEYSRYGMMTPMHGGYILPSMPAMGAWGMMVPPPMPVPPVYVVNPALMGVPTLPYPPP